MPHQHKLTPTSPGDAAPHADEALVLSAPPSPRDNPHTIGDLSAVIHGRNPQKAGSQQRLPSPPSPPTSATDRGSVASPGDRSSQTLDSRPRRPITSICISGGRLYAGGRDGTITEWDLATGLDCRTLATSVPNPTLNTKKSVTALCTLPNSSRLFSASEDGSLTFWNLATAQPIRSYRAHDGYVHAVCVSPEGRLYSGGADRLINEWDVDTGRRHWVLAGHTRWILALTACPASANNGRLYSAGNDNTVRVWDLASGKCIMVLEEHRDWVTSLCLGRDLLYSCSRDGSVKVWDTGSGRCLRSLRGHSSGAAVRAVTVAAGRLFSAGDDKAVVEWDVRQGRIVRTLTEHEEAVVALCAGADGKLFTGSIDGTVKVWEIVSPTERNARKSIGSMVRNVANGPLDRDRNLELQAQQSFDQRAALDGTALSTDRNGPLPSRPPTNPQPQPLPAQPSSSSLISTLAALVSPISKTAPPPTAPSGPSPSDLAADVSALRAQLATAQSLLAKQNRLKFRLKSELAAARTDIATLRAELAAARAHVRDCEDEIEAAKDVMKTYRDELAQIQKAHGWALEYILRQSDAAFMEIELEVASMRHLLESPWTPLAAGDADDGDDGGGFRGSGGGGPMGMYTRKHVRRGWETDSEWDSDVEVDDDVAWWRKEREEEERAGKRRKTSPDGVDAQEEDPAAALAAAKAAAKAAAAAAAVTAGRWSIQAGGSAWGIGVDDEDAAGSDVNNFTFAMSPGRGVKRTGGSDGISVGDDDGDADSESFGDRRLQAAVAARRRVRLDSERMRPQSEEDAQMDAPPCRSPTQLDPDGEYGDAEEDGDDRIDAEKSDGTYVPNASFDPALPNPSGSHTPPLSPLLPPPPSSALSPAAKFDDTDESDRDDRKDSDPNERRQLSILSSLMPLPASSPPMTEATFTPKTPSPANLQTPQQQQQQAPMSPPGPGAAYRPPRVVAPPTRRQSLLPPPLAPTASSPLPASPSPSPIRRPHPPSVAAVGDPSSSAPGASGSWFRPLRSWVGGGNSGNTGGGGVVVVASTTVTAAATPEG